MILQGGPADGRHIEPTPTDPWAWVDIIGGELVHFDLRGPCEEVQFPHRRPKGEWFEYERDPHDPDVYRYARKTPR